MNHAISGHPRHKTGKRVALSESFLIDTARDWDMMNLSSEIKRRKLWKLALAAKTWHLI
jgi:hypothetical protein